MTAGPGVSRFTRLYASSICGRGAAPWVTDFLNAAYYRRPVRERALADLRFAHAVLNTYWHRKPGHGRLHASDLVAFHRAYGAHRFDASRSARGTLCREQLEEGAQALLGEWFAAALLDEGRRGWGVAFESEAERDAYDPELRLALARPGELTPPTAAPADQVWHTYPAVPMPSADGVLAALGDSAAWPDFASELGRLTPLRSGGLDGQTFEVEAAASTPAGWPVFTLGYLTVTRLETSADERGLLSYCDELEQGMRDHDLDDPVILPYAARPLMALDLTTHAGHFMGAGVNRVVLYTHGTGVWLRAAGTWDPAPWESGEPYRVAGREAQHAFWGLGGQLVASLPHQLALRVAGGA